LSDSSRIPFLVRLSREFDPKNAKTPWAETAQEVTGEHYVCSPLRKKEARQQMDLVHWFEL